MNVAVVGSGIAGLAAARSLCVDHRVTLFVDTGFIVFNDRTYPGFARMLRDLGVGSFATRMSFSVQHEAAGLEYNGHGLGHLFARRRNLVRPGFYRMLSGILRLSREAKAWLAARDAAPTPLTGPHTPPTSPAAGVATLTLGQFLHAGRYPREVAEWYLGPMASAVWSAPASAVLDLPFEFFARFFDNHAFFETGPRPVWRTVSGGSRAYVSAILAELARHGGQVRLKTPVRWVRRSPGTHGYQVHLPASEGGVEVVTENHGAERFDAVVLATHSDTALSVLADPSAAEREVLGAMPYQENQAILHTDASLMPRRRRAWAAWNAHVPRDAAAPAAVTYNMNILQGLEPRDGSQVLVTLNHAGAVDPARVLRIIRYEHPVYTTTGFAAQRRFHEISGVSRTFFAGAYWRYGFHEDGHWSGVRAAEQVRSLAQQLREG
jgi:predicted NAD/FAD-binding protein